MGGRVDNWWVVLEEISADAPRVSVQISNRIEISDGRQIVVVEIHKTLCGGGNTEDLIEFMYFYLKISWVHMFFFEF